MNRTSCHRVQRSNPSAEHGDRHDGDVSVLTQVMAVRNALQGRVQKHTRRRLLGAVTAFMVVIGGASVTSVLPAAGSDATVSTPRIVSGPDPLDSTCNIDPARRNGAKEPSLAVNPTNRKNLVTAWIQDQSDGIVAGWSMDGGRTWSTVIVPQKFCTGGPPDSQQYLSSFDPWLSFGPDGTLYLATTLTTGVGVPVDSAVVVNTSTDGGQSWSAPVFVFRTAGIADRTTMIADPSTPGRAYVAWIDNGIVTLSVTSDHGRNWSLPNVIYTPREAMLAAPHQLLVLPNGNLVAIIGETPASRPPAGPTTLLATISDDRGERWTTATTIALVADGTRPRFSSSGVTPDGTVYVAWRDGHGGIRIDYSKSTDGAETWGQPGTIAQVTESPKKLEPVMRVAHDGTLGVLFDDQRNDVFVDANGDRVDDDRMTDVWFRHSHDGGLSWQEAHVAGPFDETKAPNELGEYQGLAATHDGFTVAFTQTSPTVLQSDIFFAKIDASD